MSIYTTPYHNPKSFILEQKSFVFVFKHTPPPLFFGGYLWYPSVFSPGFPSEVLFLTMIVVDRALYTWYRGDRRDEENTVATAASKTLVIASMKVGVFVVIHRGFGPTVWVGWFGWTCLFIDFFLWRKLGGEENVGGCDFVDVIFLDSKNKVQVFGTWLFIKDLNLKDCGERSQ